MVSSLASSISLPLLSESRLYLKKTVFKTTTIQTFSMFLFEQVVFLLLLVM